MRKMYKVKWIGAAFLCAAGLFAGAPAGYGAVYLSDSPYDWEENADSTGGYDSPRSMEDIGNGPGSALGMEDQQLSAGPSVTQVTLTEQYHEEYQVYEESINSLFFFYTNVSNGGITDKTVTMDIPQNMYCTVEKDGAEYNYIPGQSFGEYGTYVVRVSAVEDVNVPFSEQKEYRALFRFRIQQKPPEEMQQGTEGLGSLAQWGENPGSAFSESGIWPDGRDMETAESEEESGEAESRETAEQESETAEQESDTAQQESQETLSEDMSHEERDGEEKENPGGKGVSSGSYSERTQEYNSATGRYLVTFENGRTLISNVPEGYVGPSTVELSVSEGEGELYCNDEPMEYTKDMSLKEPGYYRLSVDGQIWSFVIASAVSQMDYYLAPGKMEFTEVSLDGEPMETPRGRYMPMKEDGQYQIAMAGEDGEVLEVVLRKDTESPKFSVDVKGGSARIQYLSDDIARIILEKNGEIQEGFAGYTVSSPGDYRLFAVDAAGNVSSTRFTLKYQVNRYGVVAVVMVILLMAGGAAFVIHIKRTVRIR